MSQGACHANIYRLQYGVGQYGASLSKPENLAEETRKSNDTRRRDGPLVTDCLARFSLQSWAGDCRIGSCPEKSSLSRGRSGLRRLIWKYKHRSIKMSNPDGSFSFTTA
jgi:hypothetical protein